MNLNPARQIKIQSLIEDKNLRRIFKILQGNAQIVQVLMVGGCVRNALLGIENEDIDLATSLPPETVSEILKQNGFSVIPTGLQHGTVTAVIHGKSYEITTLRRDKETDGRHAVVEFTDCWIEDAKRRDFTMNTLLMDLEGNIYDPLQQGLADLDSRTIRFAGEAKKRIEEDYLRILRYFRFHALFGSGRFDSDALRACRESADKISELSRERITQEFFKIISSDKSPEILKVMFEHDVLKNIKPSAENSVFYEHFCTFQTRYGLNALSSRLFVFAGLDFDKIRAMEQYIMFPKVFLKDMHAMKGSLNLPDLSCDRLVRESIYRFGRSATAQVLMIELVQDRVMNGYAPTALKIIQNWEIPDFPLDGHDVMKSGIEKGIELGQKLQSLENWWIDQDFKPDRDSCLRRI